jgi:hypothetical protein
MKIDFVSILLSQLITWNGIIILSANGIEFKSGERLLYTSIFSTILLFMFIAIKNKFKAIKKKEE